MFRKTYDRIPREIIWWVFRKNASSRHIDMFKETYIIQMRAMEGKAVPFSMFTSRFSYNPITLCFSYG